MIRSMDLSRPAQQEADGRAIRGPHRLHRAGGQAGGLQAFDDGGVDGQAGGQAFRTAAQDHGVARAHAQGRRVGGDVGPALIDHGDHADRRAHPGDVQAVGPGPARGGDAQRIGNRGHGLDALRHALEASLVEQQTVQHRARQAVGLGRFDVLGVGGEDLGGVLADRLGHGLQGGGALLGRGETQGARARTGGLAHRAHRRLQADARVVHDLTVPRYAQVEPYLGAFPSRGNRHSSESGPSFAGASARVRRFTRSAR
jgi:hypothetical protein